MGCALRVGELLIVVRAARKVGGAIEVVLRWRRGRAPLVARRTPGIRHGALLSEQRCREVSERDEETSREDRRAERRHHVENLELGGIIVIATRHPAVAEQKLRKKGGDESDEDEHRREESPPFGIDSA